MNGGTLMRIVTPLLRTLSTVFLASTVFAGCAVHRAQIAPGFIPAEAPVSAEDEQYGHAVLNELTKQYPLSRNDAHIRRVRRIVERLTEAARADREPWHVYVLDADQVQNAGATRGNYIFVWSGMLRKVRDDGELATILAHEIGHLLAGHTLPNPAEEANQMITGVAGTVAREILIRQGGAVGSAAGLAGALVGETLKGFIVNPESQRKEFEADQIGLFILADAGLDPERAVQFWERVADDPAFGGQSIEFFSSHPSSHRRIEELRQLLPEARRRYERLDFTAPKRERFDRSRSGPSSSEFAIDRGAPESLIMVSRYTGTQVLDDPSPSGRIVAELERGEEVKARCREGRYLRVVWPLKGFVREREIAPRFEDRNLPPCSSQ